MSYIQIHDPFKFICILKCNIRCEDQIKVWFLLFVFACVCLLVPVTFVEKTILPSLGCLCTFVKISQLYLCSTISRLFQWTEDYPVSIRRGIQKDSWVSRNSRFLGLGQLTRQMILFTKMFETEGKLNLQILGVGKRNQDFCFPCVMTSGISNRNSYGDVH